MTGSKIFQFRSTYKRGAAKINIIDLRPEDEKDIPVVFAPGWGATSLFYENILLALRDTGRRVIAVDGAMDIPGTPKNWPRIGAAKAGALMAVMDGLEVKKADLLAQSAGSFAVTLTAAFQPRSFRNLVLVTPAGFSGKMAFWPLLLHWLTNNVLNPLTRPLMAKNIDMSIPILKNIFGNLPASVAELKMALRFPLDPFIPELRGKGIKVAVLYGEGDTVLSWKTMRSHVQSADLVLPIAGPHGSLIFLPQGTEAVLKAFEELKKCDWNRNSKASTIELLPL